MAALLSLESSSKQFGGLLANRLHLPPLVGYLLAGLAVGPFTPGFVADAEIAAQLAEIGVILLMFGVGIKFSFSDLLAVRNVAVPGALIRILITTLLGIGLTALWGWGLGAGIVFGLALSVASTVVLLKTLEDHDALDSGDGRIAVGWVIVEDLVMILVLVLLPALAGPLGGTPPPGTAADNLLLTVGVTLGEIALFAVLMLVVAALMLVAGVALQLGALGLVLGAGRAGLPTALGGTAVLLLASGMVELSLARGGVIGRGWLRLRLVLSAGLALLVGGALGAAAMYLLDPERGRTRRAYLTDKATGLSNTASRQLGKTARDLSKRAQGLASQAGVGAQTGSRAASPSLSARNVSGRFNA